MAFQIVPVIMIVRMFMSLTAKSPIDFFVIKFPNVINAGVYNKLPSSIRLLHL